MDCNASANRWLVQNLWRKLSHSAMQPQRKYFLPRSFTLCSILCRVWVSKIQIHVALQCGSSMTLYIKVQNLVHGAPQCGPEYRMYMYIKCGITVWVQSMCMYIKIQVHVVQHVHSRCRYMHTTINTWYMHCYGL